MKDNKSKSSDSEETEPETESETESNPEINSEVLDSKSQVEDLVNNLATLTDKVDSMSNDLLEIKEMLSKLN